MILELKDDFQDYLSQKKLIPKNNVFMQFSQDIKIFKEQLSIEKKLKYDCMFINQTATLEIY